MREQHFIQAWIEGWDSVVFTANTNLFSSLKEFISSKLSQNSSRSLQKKSIEVLKSVMIAVRLLLQKTDLITIKVKLENCKNPSVCSTGVVLPPIQCAVLGATFKRDVKVLELPRGSKSGQRT